MRKIEDQMIAAVRNRKPMRVANTSVEIEGNEVLVRLHGHLIARFDEKAGTVALSTHGYHTATTKSRLNALVRTFIGGSAAIYQHAFSWYFNGFDGTEKPWAEVEGKMIKTPGFGRKPVAA